MYPCKNVIVKEGRGITFEGDLFSGGCCIYIVMCVQARGT